MKPKKTGNPIGKVCQLSLTAATSVHSSANSMKAASGRLLALMGSPGAPSTLRALPSQARCRVCRKERRMISLDLRPSSSRVVIRSFASSAPQSAASASNGKSGDRSEKLLAAVKAKAEQYKDALDKQQEESSVQESIARAKALKELEPLAAAWEDYRATQEAIDESRTLLSDPDSSLRQLATEEIESLSAHLDDLLQSHLPSLLLPATPTSLLPCILELKAGVGGSESCLFLEELVRMYTRFANKMGWKVVMISKEDAGLGGMGGLKEATIEMKGEGAFGWFVWERGVQRVQRVPATESQGRVHSSTVTVVVLPVLPESSETTADDIVDPKDVKSEVMRSRGAGGQHVNKTESAVRLTHIPTGISVSMQDSRSQHQNRAWAWQVLRARLLDRKLAQDVEDRRATRREQVSGASRSDKTRTYNYAQDRMTDHRIGLSVTGIQNILDGEGLEYVLLQLKQHHDSQRMESLLETGEDLDM